MTSVRTTYHDLPSSGHSKSFKIVDEDNNIIWREMLNKEIFRFVPKLIGFDSKLAYNRYENEVPIHISHDVVDENGVVQKNAYI